MGRVQKLQCDSCGKIVEDERRAYELRLESVRGWADPASGRSEKSERRLEFCEACARRLVAAVERIAVRGEQGDG